MKNLLTSLVSSDKLSTLIVTAELGFVVGSEVTVVNEIAGNLIVQVKQSRLALDKTMASRIMVD